MTVSINGSQKMERMFKLSRTDGMDTFPIDSDEEDTYMNGVGNWFKSYDRYASSVSLTYKKKNSFATVPGGILSMVSYFLVIFFFSL